MHRALYYAALPLALTLLLAPSAEAGIKRDLKSLDFAQADQSLSRGGPEFKAGLNQAGELGTFVGGRGIGYLTESLYVGGAGYGGSLSAGAVSGGFGYGGMVLGAEGKITKPLSYDVSVLFGGGGGGSVSASGASFLVEPTIALRQDLGGGMSGALSLGYLFVPQVNTLSGVMVGVRLDFKRLTITLPVEN